MDGRVLLGDAPQCAEPFRAREPQLLDKRVGQQQGHTAAVALPKGTAFLQVTPEGTDVRASVMLAGNGAAVIPLHELLTEGLVPSIRPGLS